jgi:hypothetical protein
MARHPVAVTTKQRPAGNNRAQEASDDESRKKRCTASSPEREAISVAEQALRDYEDYLFYYGLKDYYAPFVDYADCVEKFAAGETAATVETASADNDGRSEGSDAPEVAAELESASGDEDAPDDQTASVTVDAPIAAPHDNDHCDQFASTQEETARDTLDKLEVQTHADISPETSWAWALDSAGHVRRPSTSSSCIESVGAGSGASSWAEVLTPLPRRTCAGSILDNEWQLVHASDDGSSLSL